MVQPPSGHERGQVMRGVVVVCVVLFVFLVGYFLAYGPLDRQEPAYAPAGPNVELEEKAAPPPQPKTP